MMMPLSDTFTINKLEIDFVLSDGSVTTVVSRVEEKQKAQQLYEDKMIQGQTAVMATLPKITPSMSKKMLKIQLGNMPAQSKAFLRAYCNQQLMIEDLSYVFRLPMSYVPSYMANKSTTKSEKVV